jgi:hypothetical protein
MTMKRYPHLDIDQVYEARFTTSNPRSDAYKRGFRDRLVQLRDGSKIHEPWPYRQGTAERDAWIAGLTDAEGHVRFLDEDGRLPAA